MKRMSQRTGLRTMGVTVVIVALGDRNRYMVIVGIWMTPRNVIIGLVVSSIGRGARLVVDV